MVLMVKEESFLERYEELLSEYHLQKEGLEFRDVFPVSEEKEWYSELYIVTNDYGITIMYQNS